MAQQQMGNTIEYKGYVGSVEFSEAGGIFCGRVMDIPALISYEGTTVIELVEDFHGAVDDYLAFCEGTGTKPVPGFSRGECQEEKTMEKFGFVLATKMLVEGRRKVRYMYCEEPANPQDSGWRFLCGDENDDYVNNPDNIAIYDINTILEIDKSVLPYLNYPTGIALERADENAAFVVSSARDFSAGERSAEKSEKGQ